MARRRKNVSPDFGTRLDVDPDAEVGRELEERLLALYARLARAGRVRQVRAAKGRHVTVKVGPKPVLIIAE